MKKEDLDILLPALQQMVSETIDRSLSGLGGTVHAGMTIGELRRSEALRAASCISAEIVSQTIAKWARNPPAEQIEESVGDNTLGLADRFVGWLETGER